MNNLSQQLSERCGLSKTVNFMREPNYSTLCNLKVGCITISKIVKDRYCLLNKRDLIKYLLKILDCKYFWKGQQIVESIREGNWK